ncbi:MAG TPA: sigma-70 family RNA polymerase sigma factor [Myxococcales bacterium]
MREPAPDLDRLRAHDPAAQAALFREHRQGLQRLAACLLPPGADAEALVADLFIDFFQVYVHELRSAVAVPAYLRIMVVRRAQRLKARSARQGSLPVSEPADTQAPSPDDAAAQRTYLRWLEECLSALTARARSVLRLQYGHGLTFAEAGAQLGVSKQAAGKMSLKSVQSLRECLAARESGGGA